LGTPSFIGDLPRGRGGDPVGPCPRRSARPALDKGPALIPAPKVGTPSPPPPMAISPIGPGPARVP